MVIKLSKRSRFKPLIKLMLFILIGVFVVGILYAIYYYLINIDPYRHRINQLLTQSSPEHKHLLLKISLMIEANLGCSNNPSNLEHKHIGFNCDDYKDSTITRMVYMNAIYSEGQDRDTTLTRHLKHLLTSRLIVANLSNQDKNTLFCELAYFGFADIKPNDTMQQIYGCQQFANYYFNKPLTQLSSDESATLIAMTHAPTLYRRNADLLHQRKQYLLTVAK